VTFSKTAGLLCSAISVETTFAFRSRCLAAATHINRYLNQCAERNVVNNILIKSSELANECSGAYINLMEWRITCSVYKNYANHEIES
jgi:hypothetical protein